jgi:hypothetical protein
MKTIILIFFQITFFNSALFGQESISLTVSAQGKTKEEAKYNAFRDALERAFGTFISTNTQVLNDELIKDEIVSVSSGNIEKFEIKSEVQLPDGTYSNIVDVVVSVNKLKSFCESKGIKVEFQGSLFAANIRIEKMNNENEASITRNMAETVLKIVENGIFDYSIKVSEPKSSKYYSNAYDIDIVITATINNNLENIASIIKNTLIGISLSDAEKVKLDEQRVYYYRIKVDSSYYYLRNWKSVVYLRQIFERIIPYYALNFEFGNGLNTYNFLDDIISKRSIGNNGKINYKMKRLLYDNTFENRNVENVKYGLYREMNSARTLQEYYDLVPDVGIDYERRYSNNDTKYKYANIDWRWINTDRNTIELIYEEINFSSSSKNYIIFELIESLTLAELEKITEYKVKPLNK